MQSLYEVLGPSKSVEERNLRVKHLSNIYDEDLKLSIFEANYIDFIKKEENGLFSIIKRAVVNNFKGDDLCFFWNVNDSIIQQYIEYFLNKYHYKYKIEHVSYSTDMVCFLQNIKTAAGVKDLLLCYYGELQQIEYFSKSKEELWQEHHEFIINNKEWLERKKGR